MRTIKFTAGMIGEFEIIRTNAPDALIEEQLRLNCCRENNAEDVLPYDLLEKGGYVVEVVGCQDDDSLRDFEVDVEFDWYDYYE